MRALTLVGIIVVMTLWAAPAQVGAPEACANVGNPQEYTGQRQWSWLWLRRYLCGADDTGELETFGEWFSRPLLHGRLAAAPSYRFARLQLNGMFDGGVDRWRDRHSATPHEAIDRFLNEFYPRDLDPAPGADAPVTCLPPMSDLCQAWLDDLHTFHLGRGSGAGDSRRLCLATDALTTPAVYTAVLGLASLDEARRWSERLAAARWAAESAARDVGWRIGATDAGSGAPVFAPPADARDVRVVSDTVWELPWRPRRLRLQRRTFAPAEDDELPRLVVRVRGTDVTLRSPLLWMFAEVSRRIDLPDRRCAWSPDGRHSVTERWNPRRRAVAGNGYDPWLRLLPWFLGKVKLRPPWYRRDQPIHLTPEAWQRLQRFDHLFQLRYAAMLRQLRQASGAAPLKHRARLPEVLPFRLGDWTLALVLRQRRLLRGLVRNDTLSIQAESWRRIARRPFDLDAVRLLAMGPVAPFVCTMSSIPRLAVQEAFRAETLPAGADRLLTLVRGPCRLLERTAGQVLAERFGDDQELARRLTERYRFRFEGFLIGARQVHPADGTHAIEVWRVTLPDTAFLSAVFGGLLGHALQQQELLSDSTAAAGSWTGAIGGRPEMMLAGWTHPDRVATPVATAVLRRLSGESQSQSALAFQLQRPGQAVQSWALSWHLLTNDLTALPERIRVAGRWWPDALVRFAADARETLESTMDPFGMANSAARQMELLSGTRTGERRLAVYSGPGGRRLALVAVEPERHGAMMLVLERCVAECVVGASP